jgi:hypothetical protein
MELATADIEQVFNIIKKRDITRTEIVRAGVKRSVVAAAIRNLSENNIVFKYSHVDGAKYTTKRPIQSRARPPRTKHVVQIAECYQHLPLGFRMGYTNIIPARGRIIIGEAGGV